MYEFGGWDRDASIGRGSGSGRIPVQWTAGITSIGPFSWRTEKRYCGHVLNFFTRKITTLYQINASRYFLPLPLMTFLRGASLWRHKEQRRFIQRRRSHIWLHCPIFRNRKVRVLFDRPLPLSADRSLGLSWNTQLSREFAPFPLSIRSPLLLLSSFLTFPTDRFCQVHYPPSHVDDCLRSATDSFSGIDAALRDQRDYFLREVSAGKECLWQSLLPLTLLPLSSFISKLSEFI